MPRRFAVTALVCLAATSKAPAEDISAIAYSPWGKFCLSGTCFIGREGHAVPDCGPIISTLLIEQGGTVDKEKLKITLRPKVNLERGPRITIGDNQPIERPYTGCYITGCTAEYGEGQKLVDELKEARTLVVEAFEKSNKPIRFLVPLTDLAAAYAGLAQEPKVFKETQEKLQKELDSRKHEEEERNARCQ